MPSSENAKRVLFFRSRDSLAAYLFLILSLKLLLFSLASFFSQGTSLRAAIYGHFGQVLLREVPRVGIPKKVDV